MLHAKAIFPSTCIARGFFPKRNKKHKTKEAFAEALRRSLMYYFWSKCEWEVLISPWCGSKKNETIKVDVYWQVMNNWDHFLDYVWNAKRRRSQQRDGL